MTRLLRSDAEHGKSARLDNITRPYQRDVQDWFPDVPEALEATARVLARP